jgi:multiple sugar transport system substrate-binding protein
MKRHALIVLASLLAVLAFSACAPAPTPTVAPTTAPVVQPTTAPTTQPTTAPAATKPPVPTTVPTTAPTTAPTAAPTAAKKVEITFWKHNHDPADALTKTLIDEYQKQNPNVTIKLEIIPNDQWLTKLLTAVAGGTAPDMYDMNDNNIPTFISKGVLAPISPEAFGAKSADDVEKLFVPNSLSAFKGPDGKVYGTPFEFNSWPLAINDAMFKEAGLDPAKDYPKTWEEVGTIGAKLAKVNNGRFERQGFAWNLLTSGYTMLMYPTIVYQLGGSVLTNDDKGDKCNLTSPEGVQALQTMQDMYVKYKTGAPGINVATAASPMADFIQEKVAMWIVGPWATPQFKDNPNLNANYRIVPLPQATGAKRQVVAMSAYAWVVNAKSANVQEAWKFVNYASLQGARWLPTAGYVLPRLGWTDSPEAKAFKGLDVFIAQMQYGRPRLPHPNAPEINAAIHKAVQAAILNNAPAKDVLTQACTEIDTILKK